MSRRPRARAFLLDPSKLRHDPAFLLMTEEARGCYVPLFLAGWEMAEPGVVPNRDELLAQLALTTPSTWARVRQQVLTAFDVTSRPGYVVQPSMTVTHERQTAMIEKRRAAGKKSAKRKAEQRRRGGTSVEHDDATYVEHENGSGAQRISVLGSRSGTGEATPPASTVSPDRSTAVPSLSHAREPIPEPAWRRPRG